MQTTSVRKLENGSSTAKPWNTSARSSRTRSPQRTDAGQRGRRDGQRRLVARARPRRGRPRRAAARSAPALRISAGQSGRKSRGGQRGFMARACGLAPRRRRQPGGQRPASAGAERGQRRAPSPACPRRRCCVVGAHAGRGPRSVWVDGSAGRGSGCGSRPITSTSTTKGSAVSELAAGSGPAGAAFSALDQRAEEHPLHHPQHVRRAEDDAGGGEHAAATCGRWLT